MSSTSKVILNSPLPPECFNILNVDVTGETYIEQYLNQNLSSNDSRKLQTTLKWKFLLDKHASHDKQQKFVKIKRNFLTRKQRKELHLLKLPKHGWDYSSLERMRQMWRQYMRENLDTVKKAPNCRDQEWSAFSTILAKSELVGSEVTIIRSKVPSQVDLTGTVVLETKMTFQLVTPQSKLKTILKESSVFEFRLDQLKFTVFGKHLMTRPSERSVKKIKTHMFPDL